MVKIKCSPGTPSGNRSILLLSKQKGSVTMEAAMLLPVVIGFCLLWIRLFSLMSFQLELQYAMMNGVAKMSTFLAYLEEPMEDGQWTGYLSYGLAPVILNQVEDRYWEEKIVENGRFGVNCFIHEHEKALEVSCRYRMKFPLLPDLFSISTRQVAYQKYFDGDSVHENGEEEYVYITEKGTVYHVQRNCSSIKRSIRYCLKEELSEKRNQDGAIYYACEVCGKQKSDGYYITDYGERYHTTLQCPNTQRKVYLIRRHLVGERTLCRTCGGNKG